MGKKKLILLAAAVVMLAGLALTASASDFFRTEKYSGG